jgi:hypothetical protein
VITTDATVTDTDVTETVHQGLASRKLLPAEHDVDAGYTTAAHIVAAQDRYGIELLGPVGLDTHHENHQGEHFAQSAFTIDWRARTATCPPKARPAPAGLASAGAAGLPSHGCTSPPRTAAVAPCAQSAPERRTASWAAA